MKRRWLTQAMLVVALVPLLRVRHVLAATKPAGPQDTDAATHFLPLFPLGVVAFPGELVFLHIFEPRYKQLVNECVAQGISFGIVTIVPGGVSSIGTEMKLERVLRTDDAGNMDIAVRGVRAFQLLRVERRIEGKLYSGGQVSFAANDARSEPDVQDALVQQYNRLHAGSELRREIEVPYPQNLSFFIGHDVGLNLAQELQLLTIPVEHDRQLYLLGHLQDAR